MANIKLEVAIGDYDHVRDLVSGKIAVPGIDITHVELPAGEIFSRFTKERPWPVAELSLARYVALKSQDDANLTGIPVFPSRFFRQHAIYTASACPIDDPRDLKGKRVGIPVWVQTAIVWVRAWLMHDVGVALSDIHWVQAGINRPGQREEVLPKLPEGIDYTPAPGRSLVDMLREGDIDALLCADPPEPFQRREPWIRRLLPDHHGVEEAYWNKAGIFPIMHTVAMRQDVVDRHPEIGPKLLRGFNEAKDRSLERTLDGNCCRFPLPWGFVHAERMRDIFGDDFWPYGLTANRKPLEAFLDYCFEQGVCHRRLAVEELYPEEVWEVAE